MVQLTLSVPVVTALDVVPALTMTIDNEPDEGVRVAGITAEPAVKAVMNCPAHADCAVIEEFVATSVCVEPVVVTVMPV